MSDTLKYRFPTLTSLSTIFRGLKRYVQNTVECQVDGYNLFCPTMSVNVTCTCVCVSVRSCIWVCECICGDVLVFGFHSV